MALETLQLSTGSCIPELDDTHRVSGNDGSITRNWRSKCMRCFYVDCNSPQYTNSPYQRSLSTHFVRAHPLEYTTGRKVPFPQAAI